MMRVCPWVLGICLVGAAEEWHCVDSMVTEQVVPAGASWCIAFDPAARTLEKIPLHVDTLTPNARNAVAASPQWLRMPLTDTFRRLSPPIQDRYADVIRNASDPACLDEICFQIAHLSPRTLEAMDPAIVDTNAARAYRIDTALAYVDIVDFASDSSTTRYRTGNKWTRIPSRIYYWYVIMPKLVMERPRMGESESGAFWRDHLWNTAETAAEPGKGLTLGDVLSSVETFWDGRAARWENDEEFSSSHSAIRTIGAWVAKAVPFKNPLRGRPNQPNRIVTHHRGNCSEIRMVLAAAARTGLIPVIGTWHWNGNHVWNAVWWDGAWRPYQVDRWYGPTRIDLPEIGEDRLYNSEGAQDVSIVWSERADGLPVSSAELYSRTCRIVIDVTDTTGRPVDGCKVFLVSECQFGGLNGITCGTTGPSGRFAFPVGDRNNYYLRLESPPGSFPRRDNTVEKIVDHADALPDSEHPFSFRIPGVMPAPKVRENTPPEEDEWKVRIVLDTGQEACYGINRFRAQPGGLYSEEDPGYYRRITPGARIDFFVTDQSGLDAFRDGGEFSACEFFDNTGSFDRTFPCSADRRSYFVFSNTDRLNVGEFLPIRALLLHKGPLPAAHTPPARSKQPPNASREFGRGCRLSILDASGRTVRTLPPDMITRNPTLLLRKTGTAPPPHGMYFIHLTEDAQTRFTTPFFFGNPTYDNLHLNRRK